MNDCYRFEHFLDPTDSWTIWDRVQVAPAAFSGTILTQLSETEARSMCDLLNSFGPKTRLRQMVG